MFAQQLAEKLQVITTYCSANDRNNDQFLARSLISVSGQRVAGSGKCGCGPAGVAGISCRWRSEWRADVLDCARSRRRRPHRSQRARPLSYQYMRSHAQPGLCVVFLCSRPPAALSIMCVYNYSICCDCVCQMYVSLLVLLLQFLRFLGLSSISLFLSIRLCLCKLKTI